MTHLFEGNVCNVSAWEDKDKEGYTYSEYFTNAKSYQTTNFKDANARGSQGNMNNETILDLTEKLPDNLLGKFDTVFNHTTLEHIFDCDTAFKNLCDMSSDTVIVVVPFLQETHGSYGDYWRFTPQVIDKLFIKNGMKTIYLNYNDQGADSIYVFAVGTKNENAWKAIYQLPGNKVDQIYTNQVGTFLIKNSFFDNLKNKLTGLFN